ncbi:Rha family transcriptional regulator [Pseudomonas siliginis]|jgi:phage regulator Rha-like protein|uniref:Rha family transcriptional regulator n=1 Tax=Pseudomonas siliginis TaxID=2842346 RepID=A0ABY5CET2_9PSED|nr:Rha family transcriptional regulator [Pseudomonas siliginis]UST85770.1 Rha family transcriptional regulator [Pseudomonas siliginis]
MTIVIIKDGDAVTTTLAIAAGTLSDHASVIKLVRTYQSDLEEFGLLDFKSESTGGRPTEYAFLNEPQSTLLLTYMRNTDIVRAFKKKLVREFWEMVQQRNQPMTQAEITAANANHLVAVERQQREQQVALERIETRVANVEQVRYLDSRPAGFESMTTIRERINLRHGIPPWVVNAVMRDIPGAPLPFAMVRSAHADDGAQPYAIWPTADITRRFDRFAAECTFVTAERATHPDIQQGRFKLRQRTSA